jgi:quercetin dioxygenase-like cupin family protein
MLLKKGGTLAEHRARGSVSVQVLIGRLAIELNCETAKSLLVSCS